MMMDDLFTQVRLVYLQERYTVVASKNSLEGEYFITKASTCVTDFVIVIFYHERV